MLKMKTARMDFIVKIMLVLINALSHYAPQEHNVLRAAVYGHI